MVHVRNQTRRSPATHGFTLIELLIVLVIISALMALGMVVGRQVMTGSKTRVTEQLIYSLDQSLDSFAADKGDMPPPVYALNVNVGGKKQVYEFPAIDARPGGTTFAGIPKDKNWFNQYDAAVPSMATYAAILQQSSLAESILKAIPGRFVRTRFLEQWYTGTSNATSTPVNLLAGITSDDTGQPATAQSFEVLDAWGRPIRFVHPGFGREFYDGPSGPYYDRTGSLMTLPDGQKRPVTHDVYVRWGVVGSAPRKLSFRRSYQPFDEPKAGDPTATQMTGDADEGLCPTRRPYFYSAGPDGDAGKRLDNVYSTRPDYPEETAASDSTSSSSS